MTAQATGARSTEFVRGLQVVSTAGKIAAGSNLHSASDSPTETLFRPRIAPVWQKPAVALFVSSLAVCHDEKQ